MSGDPTNVPAPVRALPALLSIVVPFYNEERNVVALCDRLFAVLQGIGGDCEVVAVDDGSRDGTRALLTERARLEPRLRIVALSRNFGLQAAVAAGLGEAQGDAVALMDADLQDPPELLPRLLAEWRAGADVVFTTKRTRSERGIRRLGFELFHRLFQRMGDIALPIHAGNFSLIDRRALDVINQLPERNRYLPGLRGWVGFKQAEVAFDRDPRAAGDPRMTFRRLVRLAMDALFGFSYLPVKLVTLIGIVACVLGLGFTTWVLIEKLYLHTAILGWPSLMIAVCFLGGAQLISVGILGEYVVRIYDEVRVRPNFVVMERIEFGTRVKRTSPR
jgi:polyisoprenyl-phosphate glycosyltransferase